MENSEHHTFGPSAFGRIARCPASFRLQSLIPKRIEVDRKIAERGQLLHRLARQPDLAEERKLSDWDREQLEAARVFVRAILSLNEGAEVHYEHRLILPRFEGYPLPHGSEIFGTADVYIRKLPTITIIDHKTGPVEIDEDLAGAQVILEALMALEWESEAQLVDVRIYHWASDTEFSRQLTRNDIPAMRKRVIEVVRAALGDEGTFKPSSAGCAYCPVLAHCPVAQRVAVSAWDSIRALDRHDAETLGLLADRLDVAKAYVEAARKALAEIEQKRPGSIDGYKLVTRQARELGATEKIRAAVARTIDTMSFVAACSIGIGALERLWCDSRPDVPKEQAKRDLAVLLEATKLVTLSEPVHFIQRAQKATL